VLYSEKQKSPNLYACIHYCTDKILKSGLIFLYLLSGLKIKLLINSSLWFELFEFTNFICLIEYFCKFIEVKQNFILPENYILSIININIE